MMGAGLASSTRKGSRSNVRTVQVGNKLQGLPPITNKRVEFVSNAIKTRSYGQTRNIVFCVNQLGGIGAVSGGNNSRMFGATSDGVKDCVTGTGGCVQIVREAYMEAFGREPDPSGLRTYCIAISIRRWSKADVIADLKKNGDSLAETKPYEGEDLDQVLPELILGAKLQGREDGCDYNCSWSLFRSSATGPGTYRCCCEAGCQDDPNKCSGCLCGGGCSTT